MGFSQATCWRVAFPLARFGAIGVSLQRKERCQQIIGLNDESFSIAVASILARGREQRR
jgi:hypothetical protein